jgi:hypothetical protein
MASLNSKVDNSNEDHDQIRRDEDFSSVTKSSVT